MSTSCVCPRFNPRLLRPSVLSVDNGDYDSPHPRSPVVEACAQRFQHGFYIPELQREIFRAEVGRDTPLVKIIQSWREPEQDGERVGGMRRD